MIKETQTTIHDAQAAVRVFAERNGWSDIPTIDKFDHLHEELIEMSRVLRYKSDPERLDIINSQHDIFVDGVGDLFFGLCRLANQLDVDIDQAFHAARDSIVSRYDGQSTESRRF